MEGVSSRVGKRQGRIATEQENFIVDATLTEEEIGFLQQLADAGEAGRTITGLRSS
jgi:hypothetical protein